MNEAEKDFTLRSIGNEFLNFNIIIIDPKCFILKGLKFIPLNCLFNEGINLKFSFDHKGIDIFTHFTYKT